MRRLDPSEVYKRGIADPSSLSPEERLVYLLMEVETYAAMEGWDHFFQTDKMPWYADMKAGLIAAGDTESVEILNHYENHFAQLGVAFRPDSISEFLNHADNDYLKTCRDWRTEYDALTARRWEKVAAYLKTRGIEMLT